MNIFSKIALGIALPVLFLGALVLDVRAEMQPRQQSVIGITDLNAPKSVMVAEETQSPETTKKVKRFIIKNDPGGSLDEYIQSLMLLKASNAKFKIDGMCASACTLILAKQLDLDICVTPNAVFGIHHPFLAYVDNGEFKISYTIIAIVQAEDVWNTLFLQIYPQWVVNKINENGGAPNVYTGDSTSDLLQLDYTAIGTDVKTCVDGE